MLPKEEDEHLERRESLSNKDKIVKTICAFSNNLNNNKKPGIIFIGLKDNGKSAKLKITDQNLLSLTSIRSDGNLLPFPIISVKKINIDAQSEVAAIIVQPAKSPPMRYKGRCFVRIGPSTREATPDEEVLLTEKSQASHLPYDRTAPFDEKEAKWDQVFKSGFF